MLVTRIAPTPSGYLHAGNVANFLLTSWLAEASGGTLLLRIDDVDTGRRRREYIDDIFWAIDLLGLRVTDGPSGTGDFLARHSQTSQLDRYRAGLADLRRVGFDVYACSCSRRELAATRAGADSRHECVTAGRRFAAGRSSLRVSVPPGLVGDVAGQPVDFAAELGDFVLWRREDLPAYQLTSVVDDARMGVNAVVRGRDLLASSAAQRWLAHGDNAAGFRAGRFIHHGLLTAPDGRKLSKSAGSQSLRSIAASAHGMSELQGAARSLAVAVGITPPN